MDVGGLIHIVLVLIVVGIIAACFGGSWAGLHFCQNRSSR